MSPSKPHCIKSANITFIRASRKLRTQTTRNVTWRCKLRTQNRAHEEEDWTITMVAPQHAKQDQREQSSGERHQNRVTLKQSNNSKPNNVNKEDPQTNMNQGLYRGLSELAHCSHYYDI